MKTSSFLPLLVAAWSLTSNALPGADATAPTTVPASGGVSTAPGRWLTAGEVAPDFTVTGPKGEMIKLADLKGKIVVVDISATWCGPCQAAMPNNDRIYRKYATQGVVLLGVTADDTREAYDGWIKRNAEKYAFRMAFDPAGKDGWERSVFNTAYHVTGFPTMFVIGRDGKITETVSGGGPGEDYRLEYALARAGAKVELASLPPEPKKDPNGPKSIPALLKTPAMPAIGMGAAASPAAPGAAPSRFGSVERGAEVPDFTVTGVDGSPVKLSSFRGKTLLLHFNTSNGPQPWLTKIAETYREQGLSTFVVFSATERAAFDEWVAAHPNPGFALAWDPAGKAWAENVTNTIFGIGMYPATAVLSADGKLLTGAIGMGDRIATLVYGALARSGMKLSAADRDALIAGGGATRMGANPAGGTIAAATIRPNPGAPATADRVALLAAGAVAPDFLSRDLAGKDVHLADFKGKVVILDFWATWCGPCMQSLPHTQEMAAHYKDQGVVVLASCTSDTRAAFDKWVPVNQSKYPDLIFTCDPHERDSATFAERASASLYHVQGIPTQFVIGRDGRIVAALVGYDKGDVRAEAALAQAGIKVDAAVAAQGAEQLKRDAAEALKAADAMKKAAVNPAPPFREDFGKLKAGAVPPDFAVETVEGRPAKLSDYAKGKTTVVGIWSAEGGPPPAMLALWDDLARRYAGQGVAFLGVAGYGDRGAFDQWREKNAGKFSFPVAFDPIGKLARAEKSREQMTPEEVKAESARSRAYYDRVISMQLGGVISPIPTTIVFDSQTRLLGWMAGYGPMAKDGLTNLLLRSGMKLAAEDQPAKVYTADETKPAPPSTEPRATLIKIGAMAPDFGMTDAAGKNVRLSDFKGQVVVLDFWATWCGPCIASMPHTQTVAQTYKNQGVVVLGSCTSDARAAFEKWVAANQAKYPDFVFAHDAAERKPERASFNLYGVSGIPTQFVIGRDGRIVATVIGYLPGEVLLEGALAKAGINVAPEIVAKAAVDKQKRDASGG
jgi:peroxiredoxin